MSTNTKSMAYGMLCSVALVMFAVFGGLMLKAYAKDGPSAQNYEELKQIKENQKIIAKNRDAYTIFTQAKADNEKQINLLGKDGYTVNWEKMELAPFTSGI